MAENENAIETQQPIVTTEGANQPVVEQQQAAQPTETTAAPIVAVVAPEVKALGAVKPIEVTPHPYDDLKENKEFETIAKFYREGRLDEYHKITSTDFAKMDEVKLYEMKLREQLHDWPEDEFKEYLKDQLENKGVGSLDADAEKKALRALRAEVRDFRDGKIAQQKEFLASKPQPMQADSTAAIKAAEEKAEAENAKLAEEYARKAKSDPEYQRFETSRTVRIGGEDGMNYEAPQGVDPLATALDYGKFLALFQKTDDKGVITTDWAKWIKVNAIAANPDAYDEQAKTHWQKQGAKAEVMEIKNPSSQAVQTATTERPQFVHKGTVTR